jgi:ubiquinone/menaquinone biosynthesis C-methylase UbiE
VTDENTGARGGMRWDTETGAAWLTHADRLEHQLEPVNPLLFDAAGLRRGEVVVDVGCGRGVTTRLAAAKVGPTGRVIGIDISDDLIVAAKAQPLSGGAGPIDWIVADAQRHAFEDGLADVVMSRFGVMFFDDPAAAFANLAGATRIGGRLAFAVWQPREKSPVHQRVIDVAAATAAAHGVLLEIGPPDADQFACGVPERTREFLQRAGWADVDFQPRIVSLAVGGEGTPPAEAVVARLSVGPLEVMLRTVSPEVRQAIADALREDFESAWDGSSVRLDGAIGIVTARREA